MYVYTCKSLFHFHANAIIFLFDFCVVFLNRSSGTLFFLFYFNNNTTPFFFTTPPIILYISQFKVLSLSPGSLSSVTFKSQPKVVFIVFPFINGSLLESLISHLFSNHYSSQSKKHLFTRSLHFHFNLSFNCLLYVHTSFC
jgi:hypothetical protein